MYCAWQKVKWGSIFVPIQSETSMAKFDCCGQLNCSQILLLITDLMSSRFTSSSQPTPITTHILQARDQADQARIKQIELTRKEDYERLKTQIRFAVEECSQTLIEDKELGCATKKISNMFAHDLVNQVIAELSTPELSLSLHLQPDLYLGRIQFSDILVTVRVKDDNRK